MTLVLDRSPNHPEIQTWFDNTIHLRGGGGAEIDINMEDFCAAMFYVLVNTPIEPRDPRLTFIKIVKQLTFEPNTKETTITLHGDQHQFFYHDKPSFSLQYPGNWESEKWNDGDVL